MKEDLLSKFFSALSLSSPISPLAEIRLQLKLGKGRGGYEGSI